MRSIKKGLALSFMVLLVSNGIAAAKPNYSYTMQTNIPPKQGSVQRTVNNYNKAAPYGSHSEIGSDENETITYEELYPEITDNVLSGRISKTDRSYGETLNDAQAQTAVKKIGSLLMKNSGIDKNVNFSYSKKDVQNASTSIRGNIIVYRGLINCCELEDELAFIIGHEIGHAASYHSAKGASVAVATTAASTAILKKVDNLGVALAGSAAIGLLGSVIGKKYSRMHENDADLLAVDYMVKSGYNPLAGISILYKIGKVYPDFFSSHPSTDKRTAAIYQYVRETYPQYINQNVGTEAYQSAINEMNNQPIPAS